MSQAYTVIDVAGNQAQSTVHEKDRHDECHWSTEHGDRGVAPSFEQAQYRARTALKDSMTARRRSDEAAQQGAYHSRRR
jgi:hypothetical protein